MCISEKPRNADLLLRFLAWMLDSLILTVFSWVGAALLAAALSLKLSDELFVYCVLYGVLSVPYYVWSHLKWGTTPGKKPFGIYVVDAGSYNSLKRSQAWIRCFGYFISYLPLGLGYLLAIFNPERRALHDYLSHTVSIKR